MQNGVRFYDFKKTFVYLNAYGKYKLGDSFNLKDEDGEVLDWYSDSIVAWAYYPLGIAQTAVNVERERQAALVPNG